ncbi:leucine-rich repeat-containing protein 69 [Plakobranchus ocellatus]|uniref:Leucine-rich repeat-containing protein 69 n=1 Tax=Plakobranchus ocellatus TaxID=259542 RepID=A0AAV4D816_9GAST|nr:leucine-rich repeat-containing protein 69 [Plakobranchus ocellatus]
MTGLEELNLHDNLLESLPESICKMAKLEKLDVSDNKIKTFPLKMEELAKRIERFEPQNWCPAGQVQSIRDVQVVARLYDENEKNTPF